MKPGHKTTEFWGLITLVVTNVVAMLVVVGYVSADDKESVTGALTGVVAAMESFAVNGVLLWRYIKGREDLKKDEAIQEIGLLKIQLAQATGDETPK